MTWREGAHDDLVLAVAVAAWQAERTQTVGVWFRPLRPADARAWRHGW